MYTGVVFLLALMNVMLVFQGKWSHAKTAHGIVLNYHVYMIVSVSFLQLEASLYLGSLLHASLKRDLCQSAEILVPLT